MSAAGYWQMLSFVIVQCGKQSTCDMFEKDGWTTSVTYQKWMGLAVAGVTVEFIASIGCFIGAQSQQFLGLEKATVEDGTHENHLQSVISKE